MSPPSSPGENGVLPLNAPLRIERVSYHHDDAARLIAEVQQEFARRYGTPDEGPIDGAAFDPPRGAFYVGYVGDDAVATGAWRRRDDVHAVGTRVTAEIKRMYVAPTHQRRGHARRMLEHLEATARAAGVEAMILETGGLQPEAIALYESEGYTRITPYGYYKHAPDVVCMAKRLG